MATGFDDSYYASRDNATAKLLRQAREEDGADMPHVEQVDEATMAELDMELKEPEHAETVQDFHKDDETPNIWALSDDGDSKDPLEEDDELDKPSFLRRFKRKGSKANSMPAEVMREERRDDTCESPMTS